jgi:sugar phosphate isomerase/epimerase
VQLQRREFLKTTSVLTVAGLTFPQWLHAERIKDVGLSLYTVRDDINKDVAGTMKAVSKLGYKFVEGYANEKGHFFGMTPQDFKKLISDLGMRMPSLHVVTGRVQPEVKSSMANNWERIVADMASFGVEYIVCPWIHENERRNIDDYKKLAQFLNEKAEYAAKSGVKMAYHAHDFEFLTLDGQTPYDVLLAECDRNLIQFELDLYWVTKGGKDPIEYFEKYPGRFPMFHVKDMDNTDKKSFTEVGNGIIDFKRIFKASKKAGVKYYYVEQDHCAGPPLKSIETSIKYLKKMEF